MSKRVRERVEWARRLRDVSGFPSPGGSSKPATLSLVEGWPATARRHVEAEPCRSLDVAATMERFATFFLFALLLPGTRTW